MSKVLFLFAGALAIAAAFTAPVTRVGATRAAVSMMADAKEAKEAPAKAKKKVRPPRDLKPGEGDPFGAEAQAYGDANRDGGAAFQPRGISDATVIDTYQTYIETDDEPWHATCKSPNLIGMQTLTSAVPSEVVEEEKWNPPKVGGDKAAWKVDTSVKSVASTHDNSR